MTDDQFKWLQLAVALVAGGAMGALINNWFSHRRERVQPVGYRVEETPLFDNEVIGSNLTVKASEESGWSSEFSNLHIIDVEVINKGNKDFQTFGFGLTLPSSENAIRVAPTTSDRHHQLQIRQKVDARTPVNELDFQLTPFNRGDRYSARIFVNAAWLPREGSAPSISSSEAIRFTRLPSPADLEIKAALLPKLRLGPLEIKFGPKG